MIITVVEMTLFYVKEQCNKLGTTTKRVNNIILMTSCCCCVVPLTISVSLPRSFVTAASLAFARSVTGAHSGKVLSLLSAKVHVGLLDEEGSTGTTTRRRRCGTDNCGHNVVAS